MIMDVWYPLYDRRNYERFFQVGDGIFVDSKDVPYNPCLSRKCNCHINIEVCISIQAINYVTHLFTKYTIKRPIQIEQGIYTVKRLINARYCSFIMYFFSIRVCSFCFVNGCFSTMGHCLTYCMIAVGTLDLQKLLSICLE